MAVWVHATPKPLRQAAIEYTSATGQRKSLDVSPQLLDQNQARKMEGRRQSPDSKFWPSHSPSLGAPDASLPPEAQFFHLPVLKGQRECLPQRGDQV